MIYRISPVDRKQESSNKFKNENDKCFQYVATVP